MDGLYGNNEIIRKEIVTYQRVAFFYVSKEAFMDWKKR